MQQIDCRRIKLEDFDQFVTEQLSLDAEPLDPNGAPARNDNPFEAPPYMRTVAVRRIPHCVYYFRYTWSNNNTPIQDAYYFDNNGPIDAARLREIAKELTENARKPAADQNPRELPLTHYYGSKWNRVSYVILVVDDPEWDIAHSASTGSAAIVFFERDGSLPNHSFYDGDVFTIRPLDYFSQQPTEVTAATMINYMVDENGVELPPGVSEHFRFKMACAVPSEPPGMYGIDIDPGGENEGPPIGPP